MVALLSYLFTHTHHALRGTPDTALASQDEPQLRCQRRRRDRPVLAGRERPPDLQWRSRYAQHLSWLHGLKVPHDHRAAKVLHRLRILDQLPQLTHVILPTGETRSQQNVL